MAIIEKDHEIDSHQGHHPLRPRRDRNSAPTIPAAADAERHAFRLETIECNEPTNRKAK